MSVDMNFCNKTGWLCIYLVGPLRNHSKSCMSDAKENRLLKGGKVKSPFCAFK